MARYSDFDYDPTEEIVRKPKKKTAGEEGGPRDYNYRLDDSEWSKTLKYLQENQPELIAASGSIFCNRMDLEFDVEERSEAFLEDEDED